MVAKHIRVERPRKGGKSGEWQIRPNCEKLSVWEVSRAEALPTDDQRGAQRVIFHVDFAEGAARGDRVTYMGEQFDVLEVADSQRLRGIELRCMPRPGKA